MTAASVLISVLISVFIFKNMQQCLEARKCRRLLAPVFSAEVNCFQYKHLESTIAIAFVVYEQDLSGYIASKF